MTTPEFIRRLQQASPATAAAAPIEKKYHTRLSNELRTILSLCPESIFWSGNRFCRLLTLPEIVQASENLHFDFIQLKIIPFFDCGENDFIVYLLAENKWAMLNIVDEVCWKKNHQLEALLPHPFQ